MKTIKDDFDTLFGSVQSVQDDTGAYRPILARWMLEMALMFEWHKPSSTRRRGSYPQILDDEDFCSLDGTFICTTNLMEQLDQASLRRFAFKVKFDYLTKPQRISMFRQELTRLGGDVTAADSYEPQVIRLDRLTPGDFAVAVRQFELWGTAATAQKLYEQLAKECEAKGVPSRRIGFGA